MMKKFFCLFLLCSVLLGTFGTADLTAAQGSRKLEIKKTMTLKAPASWKKVSWKCSNHKIKIIKKKGKNNRQVSIRGIKTGASKLTAVSGKKKKVYRINVVKKETDGGEPAQDKAKAVTLSLQSATLADNTLRVTIHIKNNYSKWVGTGYEAKFYRWDAAGNQYAEIKNETIIPAVWSVVQAGKEGDMTYQCYSSSEIFYPGQYKIVLEDYRSEDYDSSKGTGFVIVQPEFVFTI